MISKTIKTLLFVLMSLNLSAQIVYAEQMTLMGSLFSIMVVVNDTASAKTHIKTCVEEIERIENLISEWRPNTEISKVNQNAGKSPVTVSREVFELTQRALQYSRMSNGAFDISIAALDKIWKFDGSMKALPSEDSIRKSVEKVGYQHIQLDALKSTIFLEKEGMKIGFGSIGKGYAADQARDLLINRGVKGGIVDASGDIATWGVTQENKRWLIGVNNPYEPGKVKKVLKLTYGAVATSGSYEKFVNFNDKRYAHIINPQTGWPSVGLTSVTVVGPSAEFCNALSTSIMVLGKENGKKLIRKYRGYETIMIEDK